MLHCVDVNTMKRALSTTRRGQSLAPGPRPCARTHRYANPSADVTSGLPALHKDLDDRLSNRWIDLDPAGYFIITVDHDKQVILAEHYFNLINGAGLACDPETGEPIGCSGAVQSAAAVYTGSTAKQLSVELIEKRKNLVTRLDHANYLGRELQRAEYALLSGSQYVQD